MGIETDVTNDGSRRCDVHKRKMMWPFFVGSWPYLRLTWAVNLSGSVITILLAIALASI